MTNKLYKSRQGIHYTSHNVYYRKPALTAFKPSPIFGRVPSSHTPVDRDSIHTKLKRALVQIFRQRVSRFPRARKALCKPDQSQAPRPVLARWHYLRQTTLFYVGKLCRPLPLDILLTDNRWLSLCGLLQDRIIARNLTFGASLFNVDITLSNVLHSFKFTGFSFNFKIERHSKIEFRSMPVLRAAVVFQPASLCGRVAIFNIGAAGLGLAK